MSAIVGMIFTLIIGTLLHYFYDWSGGNQIAAIFGSVNESTWEHLKLIFWPMLVFSIVEYFAYGKNLPNFIPARVFSILFGMTTIVILFYTYTGIIGSNCFFADIITFVLAVAAAYIFGCWAMKNGKFSKGIYKLLGWIILILLIAFFVIFTFDPPKLNLFLDPVSGEYGIEKK